MTKYILTNQQDINSLTSDIVAHFKYNPVTPKFLEVEIKHHKKHKTKEQLGYYYACVIPALKDALERKQRVAWEVEEVDTYLKRKAELTELVTIDDVVTGDTDILEIIPSKANMSIDQVSKLIEASAMVASKLGVNLPDPNEYKYRG